MQCGSFAGKKIAAAIFLISRNFFLQSIFFGNQSDLRLDLPIIFIHYI